MSQPHREAATWLAVNYEAATMVDGCEVGLGLLLAKQGRMCGERGVGHGLRVVMADRRTIATCHGGTDSALTRDCERDGDDRWVLRGLSFSLVFQLSYFHKIKIKYFWCPTD